MYAGSDSIFSLTANDRRENFKKFFYFAEPIYVADQKNQSYFEDLIKVSLVDLGESYRSRKDLETVTDDNMLTEYKKPLSRMTSIYQWRDVSAIK